MANNFLEHHSEFDDNFELFLRGRYYTMRIALNLLSQQPGKNIVETGCVRRLMDYGGGNSTYIFGWFVSRYGGSLTTIDISLENIKVCMDCTIEFSKDIHYIAEDSLLALPKLSKPIDLLYLDSMDVPEDNSDASEGQLHNLKELKAAEHLLHPGSLVLIDDNDMENGGKSAMTKKYLAENGYKLILNLDQSLWMK
jgi:hypothetical protein